MTNKIQKDISRIRREVARGSIFAFARIYLKHHLKLPPSQAHLKIYEILHGLENSRGQKHAFAAPREFGKSTQVTLVYVLYCVCFGLERFIVIVSHTLSLAVRLLANVISELVENKLITEDFSELFECKGILRPPKWTRDEIKTGTGITVVAFGKGKASRGIKYKEHRPSLILADDIEKGHAYSSCESLKKDQDWFRKAIMKLGAKDTNAIILGTNFSPHCLLGELLDQEKSPDWKSHVYKALEKWPENTELWQNWSNIFNSREKYKEGTGLEAALRFYLDNQSAMDFGAKSLWPEKWSIYDLMVEHETEPVVFSSERQNMPIDLKLQIFLRAEMHFWCTHYKNFGELLKGTSGDVSYFGSCDPAMGGGDYTAIIILMKDNKTKIFYVIEADIKRRSVNDTINEIVAYARRYHFTKFVVESNGFQKLAVEQLKERCREAGVRLPLVEVKNTRHKKERISSMQPFTRTGALQFNKSHTILLEQLYNFPMYAHDDGPDALEMTLTAAQGLQKLKMRIVGPKDYSWIRDYRENFGWNI